MVEVVAAEEAEIAAAREAAAGIVADRAAEVRAAAARTVAEAGAKQGVHSPCDRTTASLWMPLLFVLPSPPCRSQPTVKIMRWMLDHMLWEASGAAGRGFWPGLWATRKLLIALAGSGVLTWREWVEHRPPEIVIIALIHFVFVFAMIALLVYAGLWFRARKMPSSQTPP